MINANHECLHRPHPTPPPPPPPFTPDPAYAQELLTHAKQLWQFAMDHPGKYSDSVQAAAGFYRSFNLTDEMCFGSLWLYQGDWVDERVKERERERRGECEREKAICCVHFVGAKSK